MAENKATGGFNNAPQSVEDEQFGVGAAVPVPTVKKDQAIRVS